ncbi:MupG family TIM beta-alpha barrel fold protein [Micropruina sp.]|uniref:MupG family TIM beta-alpha barrel fold protein n=1 Tax=Micropruina sp. TaxID=2737536 RepID=UPI0039E44F56
MLFSLYPTDSSQLRAAVVAQALAQPERLVFTSFHIPESEGLLAYGEYLRGLHEDHGLTFCGDVSPATLDKLSIRLDEIGRLRDWGVVRLRIDYGFTAEQIRRIAREFPIAVNASTVNAGLLDELAGLEVIGWHNYYPRPETGLEPGFYLAQNRLFAERGLPVYGFIPGEVSFRAPLFAGLPLLEQQRHRNSYRNAVELLTLSPEVKIFCAEGTLLPEHLRWIDRFEQSGEVTLPLTGLDPSVGFLVEHPWRLRVEGAEASFRLEGTRAARTPSRIVNADQRLCGSLQMDLAGYGRYCGEIHLMRTDRPLHHLQARVAEIASPYLGLVDLLRPGMTVRFEQV